MDVCPALSPVDAVSIMDTKAGIGLWFGLAIWLIDSKSS